MNAPLEPPGCERGEATHSQPSKTPCHKMPQQGKHVVYSLARKTITKRNVLLRRQRPRAQRRQRPHVGHQPARERFWPNAARRGQPAMSVIDRKNHTTRYRLFPKMPARGRAPNHPCSICSPSDNDLTFFLPHHKPKLLHRGLGAFRQDRKQPNRLEPHQIDTSPDTGSDTLTV